MTSFQQNVIDHIKAGYQVLLIPTCEESRVSRELDAVAKALEYGVTTWDELHGFEKCPQGGEPYMNPAEAIEKIRDREVFGDMKSLMIFRDLHSYHLENHNVRRALKDGSERLGFKNKSVHRPVILLQPTPRVHPDLAPCVAIIDFEMPTAAQLMDTVNEVQRGIKDEQKRECSDDLKYKIVQGLMGLTAFEASNCLALCIIRHKGFVPEIIDTIEETKAGMLKQTEILTYIPKEQIPPASELGGYDELISFIDQRALAYTAEAAEVNLDMPKGLVLVGVPGTGKSKAAEVIASRLQLPLVIFDFSAVFNALVGESERRTREVISKVTAMGGCVLLVDEADKALGGSADATGDSGVTRRVFGAILTWLAKKRDRTFVVFTANRTKGLPPELLRKGRFDEIFFVDTPTETERRSILEIHMTKRNVDPKLYSNENWKQFLSATEGFVGSELEETISASRFSSFQLASVRKILDRAGEAQRLKNADLQAALKKELDRFPKGMQAAAFSLSKEDAQRMLVAIPSPEQIVAAAAEVAQTMVTKVDKANIDEIRSFGKDRARRVSSAGRTSSKKNSRSVEVGEN